MAISATIHWRRLCGSVAILPLRLLRYSIYFEDEHRPTSHRQTLTRDEARRRAANMLPDLLRKVDAKNCVPSSGTLVQRCFTVAKGGE